MTDRSMTSPYIPSHILTEVWSLEPEWLERAHSLVAAWRDGTIGARDLEWQLEDLVVQAREES
jgi:hypothetical protein